MKIRALLFAMLALVATESLTHAEENDPYSLDAIEDFLEDLSFYSMIGECGDPCIIRYNMGGPILYFTQAAASVKRTGRQVIIAGSCYSACALFADKARPNVCLEESAKFHFHQGKASKPIYTAKLPKLFQQWLGGTELEITVNQRFEPAQSPDIYGWVLAQDGFPEDGFLEMDAKEASQFWPWCNPVPMPRLKPPR